ncbi:WD40 repeat-like protein [Fomitopsis serialis]|uniref:WD40 repeat-like protein n=1 Tax=Fomitopsis serialis TaxID=139415 RepID=UPI00200752D0|nr:WD40 repeat-like protein [Neoantrodia serialis]KAH9930616.1 WD40 repeat-like protein [Neoantrodia serialis]
MRPTEPDQESAVSVQLEMPEAGPSSVPGTSNGHNGSAAKQNGYGNSYSNGYSKASATDATNGGRPEKQAMSTTRVSLPGSTLYDDSYVDREEFVRLVIQSLRDVGYIESAATLEAESGYTMESSEVAEFRRCILDADWTRADAALMRLGVADDERLWEAKFLISQQKYLEMLEANKVTAALHVLRNELAPLNVDRDQLHALSSLMMCSNPEDLRQRAGWDGASGHSRRRLLGNLQRYIPSSVMIPQRRFATLLDQARAYQQSLCLYHNAPSNSRTFSLYTDHLCDKDAFPRVTTAILEVHTDEVWNLEWSHSGNFLASASKDKTAIIWRVEHDKDPSIREISQQFILRDHPYPVGCVAWSLDDSILLTSAEDHIKLWNTRTGLCVRSLEAHSDVVTALAWLPDGSGFISGGLDRKIILWDADGKQRDSWGQTPIRVTDLTVTPDFTRLVAVGMYDVPTNVPGPTATPPENGNQPGAGRTAENRVIVYDLLTKQPQLFIPVDGELTSVEVSEDSRYALINRAPEPNAPCEIHLWDLESERIARRYLGHKQSKHVIRSCFGGIDGSFVASGSEDAVVYIWHRDTGTLLEALSGHGPGSVNSVAWNPRNERMFASCSDDKTIRIWEAPPVHVVGVPVDAEDPRQAHEVDGKGKGKSRERWDGQATGSSYGLGSSSGSTLL